MKAAPKARADAEGEEDRRDRDDVVPEVDHVSRSTQIDRSSSGSGSLMMANTPGPSMAAATISSEVALADGSGRAADALGVDQLRAQHHADQERRRHAGAALVEELDHRGVGADGDDELGAVLVGRSMAMSSLVPGASNRRTRGPRSSSRSAPGRGRRGRRARRARRRSAGAARDTESKSPMMTSGLRPSSSRASAPPSTPISTGRSRRM